MWPTALAVFSGRTAVMRSKQAHWDVISRKVNCASAMPNQATGDETQKTGSLKNLDCGEGAAPAMAGTAALAAAAV